MELLTMSISEVARLAVLERLAAGDLTQAQAARQLGLSVRQVKRLCRRFRRDGAAGVVSLRRGRPSNRRIPLEVLSRALTLVVEHYHDFGPTFAAEKLRERHNLAIDHETLRRAMIAEGLWKPKRRPRRAVHPPRERRPCFGELAQIDGSHHAWFETRAPKCTLLVDVDDATSTLLALHFAEEETTQGYFELARQHILEYGVPLAFYSDKFGVFRINVESTQETALTQFGLAMQELDVESICANSPQAKGRVERANSTLQTRLVRELRLRNISTIAAANAYLSEFIADYNRKFAKLPECDIDVHRVPPPIDQLDRILCLRQQRTISKNLTVQFENYTFEILMPQLARRLQHAKVLIRIDRNGELFIEHDGTALPYRLLRTQRRPSTLNAKALERRQPANRRIPNPLKAHVPPMTHPWKAGSYRAFLRGHL
jgi:transposase